ncbi:MAG: IS21 family transposase, partial [Thermoanaerobaculia bacterium]
MRKVREILRLKHEVKLSHRDVAESLGVPIGVVSKVVNRAALAGLEWTAAAELSEEAVEERLYGVRAVAGAAPGRPDPEWIHTERKRPGVTLELLHLEYLREHPAGYPHASREADATPVV